ncbi:hypothetical protein BSZ05_22055 [Vibrio mediterranei]|uniref:Uncharacterized protein n=1 Tax=Vibrio mediterranei TaxID=689 RepID=A0AAN1FKU3_9VIBR|nr:hypothetical protein BSZ05_22055 [Vibrio mediterranei]
MNSRALSTKLMTTGPLLVSILLNYEKKEISEKIRLMFGDNLSVCEVSSIRFPTASAVSNYSDAVDTGFKLSKAQ